MACWRVSSIRLSAGPANFQMKKKTMAKAMIPPINSDIGGRRRSMPPPPSASSAARYQRCILFSASEEEQHEPDQGERLREGHTDEHVRADHAGCLGLAGHGLHGVTGNDADADSGADGSQAVSDHVDTAGDAGRLLGEHLGGSRDHGEYCVHCVLSFLP